MYELNSHCKSFHIAHSLSWQQPWPSPQSMFDWIVVMATVCLQDSGLIFRALDAKVHIMLVWLIYSLTWAVPYSLQFSFIRGQLPTNLWNVITRLALSFFGFECDHGIHPFKLVYLVMWPLKLIQTYLILPIELWRTLDLFFLLGVFLLQKWRDCLEPMLPWWQIEILASSFSREPLSKEKASRWISLYSSCHSSTLCVALFCVVHTFNLHIILILTTTKKLL